MSNLPTTLPDWLAFLEARQSERIISLGLERVQTVKAALGLTYTCPVIMVAGTNGKGSTCAMLESILLEAGYRVGLYIKPHFLEFNERAQINGESASDDDLITAFAEVEAARGEVKLSYFEFTTLAIMHLLAGQELDVVILEVGLGGRLDAVNVVDADVAIVTSIDIDHTEYLGDARELIGWEKAGIFRPGKTAICSDPKPPLMLIDYARQIGADLWQFGRDFNYSGDKQQWNYGGRSVRRPALAYPGLRGANQLLNACGALAALEVLRQRLPVSAQHVRTGLIDVTLPGRFQILPGRPTVILDVAHNPHAAATLAQNLANMGFYRYTYAVFGSMLDKDIAGVIGPLKEVIDHWCVATLPSPRAESGENLLAMLQQAGVESDQAGGERTVQKFADAKQAYLAARGRAGEDDRIVVFGSFLTVAAVLALRNTRER
jgi:dihydrofolate synthase/folylpolyglutamate synthase